jgi:DNA-binding transcriptional regulator LsrR (DeoR family)
MLYHLPKPERNAELISRWKKGETQSDLARAFNLSRQRVSQLVARAKKGGTR